MRLWPRRDAGRGGESHAVHAALQPRSSEPPRTELAQQNPLGERPAFGLDEATQLLSVSKATIYRLALHPTPRESAPDSRSSEESSSAIGESGYGPDFGYSSVFVTRYFNSRKSRWLAIAHKHHS
jgi:hypothetical protein